MFWKALKQAVIYAAMLAVVALFVFPFYWLLISAFKTKAQIFVLPPQFVPDPVVVQNFADVFRTTPIARAFVNSCVIAGGHTLLALFLCSMGGYAFAKYSRAPGRDKLFAFVLGTMMIPAAVTLIPVFIVLTRLHLVNTYWAMILPGAANAFGIFWMRQYIAANVHDDLLAAARMDGCSEFGIYRRVVMPLSKPALATVGLFSFLAAWNEFMGPLIYLLDESRYTLSLGLAMFTGQYGNEYGMLMAASTVVTIPIIVLFFFTQRTFIQGMTMSGIKG